MTTLDRIDPGLTVWTPSASGVGAVEEEEYTGRHRKPGAARRSIFRMLYMGRHRYYKLR
jgi:hypothetical protein